MKSKNKKNKTGKVYLVGAGPGDPGLLTLRGARLLAEADLIVYDRLISESLIGMLEEWSPQAEKVYAGKPEAGTQRRHAGAAAEQQRINELLAAAARHGKRVVRLKGGDPFVFGRGGEEASFLAERGIPFELVPGVSAGLGVPAYAGIPLTDRRYASSVTFLTAHEESDKHQTSIHWQALAEQSGTLVCFMGVGNLDGVVRSLTDAGKSFSTPVSVIEWGTLPSQRVVEGTLKTIADKVRSLGVGSPALTVIGEVNRLRRDLAWFEKKPLYGKTVLITRARTQTGVLKKDLNELGARVLEYPAITIAEPKDYGPLDGAIFRLEGFDWVVFTSVNGVHFFMRRLRRMGYDARRFFRSKIAVVGRATGEALRDYGLQADLRPDQFHTRSLLAKFEQMREINNRSFLLARTDIAPDALRKGLEARGGRVREVTAYRTLINKSAQNQLKKWVRNDKIDYVIFTSSSTVRSFFEGLPKDGLGTQNPRFISIGPVTSETLKSYGHKPYRQARDHTLTGVMEVLTHGRV